MCGAKLIEKKLSRELMDLLSLEESLTDWPELVECNGMDMF